MKKQPQHVIILGAGPAGLAVGHEFTSSGGKVTVLERNDYVGGLCRTVEYNGYKFDLGGHRWFTKNDELNNWFKQLMEGELVDVERISRIYYNGKYFFYPIQFGDIMKKTGPFTIVWAGVTFIWAMLKQVILNPPVVNMQQAYTSQFGSKLYDMFFRRYTEKVWGCPCEELSSDWVSQRSKGLSIWTVVREAIVDSGANKAKSLIDEFMYPRYGFVRVPERMAEDITGRGNEVILGATVTKINYIGPDEFEVVYKQDNEEHTIKGDAVVSTIPLGVLARVLTPQCDEAVEKAATNLEFRDLITVNVILKCEQVSPDTWLYIQDSDILFGRMHEPKNWSKDMVPENGTSSLVLECFCSKGDHIWNMTDDEIVQRCVRDLVDKLKFIKEDEFIDAAVVRTLEAYPVYDLDYANKTKTIHNFLNKFEGLYVVGRGGTFRYNNSDHSVEMGLMLGQRLLGHDIDHMEVNLESEYQEIKYQAEVNRDSYQISDEKKAERN